jgi:anti-anti-sigma factor
MRHWTRSALLRCKLSDFFSSLLDSSGLGTIVGLYVSAKRAKSELKVMHLNERLKELISLTRLGEFLADGRDPSEKLPP